MKKSLRIIISLHLSQTKNQITQKILSQFFVSYCALVYQKDKFNVKKCRDVLWLNHDEIAYGQYPVEMASCIPLDEPLLRKLSYCEVITLQMMNRADWDETLTYSKRKEIYLNHVRFWNNELLTKRIDICVFYEVPHTVYDYILYCLCKIHAVPVICVASQRFKDSLLLTDDYEKVTPELLLRYNHLSLKLKSYSLQEIKKTLSHEFIEKITLFPYLSVNPVGQIKEQRIYEKFLYIIEIMNTIKRNPLMLVYRLCNPLFFFHRLKSILNKPLLDMYYLMHSGNPTFSKKYIYVALHYQPECTTSPMAGIFVNQELIVHLLHQILPKDIYLYVKEHPVPSNTMRSLSFYRSLLVSPRVILIRKSVNSQQLIKHSMAVATATGTVGWEALLQQKPVMMFGYDFYQYAPGVFQITSLESCRDAIDKIIRKRNIPSLRELYIFFKAMEDVFIDGYLDYYFRPYSDLSHEKNIQNISSALIQAIKKVVISKKK